MCECALPRALIPVTHPLATIGGENAQVADGVRWSFAYRDSLSCVAINGLRGLGLPGIDARVTLAVMSMFPGVLGDVRRGALDGCVPAPEVRNEGSEFGGTFERGEGA